MKTEPLPKSISGFTKSDSYILESQIGKMSMIRPFSNESGKKVTFVALFNGEKVYHRGDISKLESSGGWKKVGREVLKDETPISTISRKRGHQTHEKALYGDWQTAPIQVSEVIDGILPSNEHGNIEVWNGNQHLLPVGTSLVKTTRTVAVSKIASELGIQHRQALFGFEDKYGARFPVFGGIVVLKKDSDIIEAALDQLEHEDQQHRENLRVGKVMKNWRTLVGKVITRLSLRERYKM